MCYDSRVDRDWGGMMKKRWLVYLGVGLISIIGSILLKDLDDSALFLFYWPIRGFSYLIETMSHASPFGNFVAWILLILVSGIPLGLGYLILKKDLKRFDFVGLSIIGFTFGITVYFIINTMSIPSWVTKIEFFSEVADIKPFIAFGIINVWCGFVLAYLVIRLFIIQKTMGKYFLSLMVALISFTILIFIPSLFKQTLGFSTPDLRIQTLGAFFNIVIFISMMVFMELITLFLENIQNQTFTGQLPKLTKWIKLSTLVMISTALINLILSNLLQLIYLGELNDISFEFTIDMIPWLFVFFFYGLYHYISHANDIMEEAELTI